MFSPRALAFDLDGTLIDTRPDIAAACNHALVLSGRRELRPEVIARYVGDGARRLVARAAGLTDVDAELDPIVESFVAYYLEHPVVHTTWMPHAQAMLDALQGVPLAVCTNKPSTVAERVLRTLGVFDRFATVVGGGDTPEGKPSGQPMELVASRLDVPCKAMIIIGDGTQDVLAGRAVGARTIAVSCGYTSVADLRRANPDVIVDTLAEVAPIVERWRESTVRTRSLV
ncbi:MAG: HAD-IA family hydrolase [Deltaproteobacteria bacterium]|nr:HAD-IA family hydrolase [Deltaproteobacteria bacterium]